MQLAEAEYARKRIHNGYVMHIENSVAWDNCSALLGKPHEAEQLPLKWNFQSAPHKQVMLSKLLG